MTPLFLTKGRCCCCLESRDDDENVAIITWKNTSEYVTVVANEIIVRRGMS